MKKKLCMCIMAALLAALSVSALTLAHADDGVTAPLLYTDDCTSLTSPHIAAKTETLQLENGIKRGDDSDGYVIFQAEKDIGRIEVKAWCSGGFADFNYAHAAGNKNLLVYVSKDNNTYEELSYTYAEAQEENLTDVTAEPEEGGYRYVKLVLHGNVSWNPQIRSVSLYGYAEPEEKPILRDTCADMLKTLRSDDNIKTDPRGFTRSDKQPGAVYYAADADVGRVELLLNVFGGYPAWEFDVQHTSYNIRVFVANQADGPYSELTYTASEASAVADGWGQVKIVSAETTAKVRYVRLLMDADQTESWVVCIRTVELYASSGELPSAESVEIVTEGDMQFEAGLSLSVTARTVPAGVTVFYAVFDDEACKTVSEYAYFDGNVLKADFYDLEDRTVYVTATADEVRSDPVAVRILRRPDAQSVTFTASKTTFANSESILLSGTALPAHAINTEVEFSAYADAACTAEEKGVRITDGRLSLADGFTAETFYVKPRVLKADDTYVYGDAQMFTVLYRRVLVSDDCKTLNNANATFSDRQMFALEKNTIKRQFGSMLNDPNYAALGQGSARSDATKYGVPSVTYRAASDIGELNISVFAYDEGNGALLAANKAEYIGLINVYMSADNTNWTQVALEFTADTDVGNLFEKSAYSHLTYKNAEAIPDGMRYARIDLLGQVALTETEDGGKFTYERYSGVLPAERYGEIKLYYNTYSPFLTGVTLYAAEDAEVHPETLRIFGEQNMSVRVGQEGHITLYRVLSDSPDVPVAVTDFDGVTYTVSTGGEYIELTDGSDIVRVKDGYDRSGIVTVTFRATADGVTSEDIELRIIVPVTGVTVTAQKTNVTVGESVRLSAVVAPSGASLPAVTWTIAQGAGELTADGTFTATEAGTVKITATADGVTSEAVTITVTDPTPTKPATSHKKKCGSQASASTVFGLSGMLLAAGGICLLTARHKRKEGK